MTAQPGIVHLHDLLGSPLLAKDGTTVGKVDDVVARLPEPGAYPVVRGLVAKVGGRQVYVGMKRVTDLGADEVSLSTGKLDVRPFERRDGEVLLRADLLGHRLIDVRAGRLVRARDLELSPPDAEHGWRLTALDTSVRRRLLGVVPVGDGGGHVSRDWSEFEALIGHAASAITRNPLSRLSRLRPAQIANLVEDADKRETAEILAAVHGDRELEADVFEEMEPDRQVQVLRHRSDAEIADVLVNMRADDAADLLAELPQDRRLPTLALLPVPVQAKIRALLGFNPATAGGLMNPDFLALPADTIVGAAVRAVSEATTIPAEVLATVYVTQDGTLSGALTLAGLLQADQAARLGEVAEGDPVRVGPQADVTEVAVKMTDYNLLTMPVVDPEQRVLGVVTVDDVLEATVPEEWWRREDGDRDHSDPRLTAPSGGTARLPAGGS